MIRTVACLSAPVPFRDAVGTSITVEVDLQADPSEYMLSGGLPVFLTSELDNKGKAVIDHIEHHSERAQASMSGPGYSMHTLQMQLLRP